MMDRVSLKTERCRSFDAAKAITLCGILIAMTCCQSTPAFPTGITKDQAIALATKEVARQHWSLPNGYEVRVEEGTMVLEPDRIRTYDVTFSIRTHGHERRLYGISVNFYNGSIEDVLNEEDYRPENVSVRDFRRKR